MNNESLLKNIYFVVFGNDRWRIKVKTDKYGVLNVIYDAHEQSVADARRTIRNIVNISRMNFRLIVIHGHNNGTAIRDMLWHEDFRGKVTSISSPCDNMGKTILRVTA